MEDPELTEDKQDIQDDCDMSDAIRLSAPDAHKDYAVRRRSFDDAQSRLKCRKLLGIGGKEPSKVLQVLGSHESYFISIPRGYETWQVVVPVFLTVVSIMLMIFPSYCLRALGDSKESTSFAGSLCCRLLASALIGIAGISWETKPITISSIKRILLLHSTYCGAATLFLALACISLRTRFLIVLTAVHTIVAAVSLFYFVAVRKLNKPTPEKPNAKNGYDENHIN
ncbi:uncharacterized protein LOC111321399 isoform X1 [Stylophora pistillata]|uniref:uncharacterized protein LOC111321399 isoform X1 n=2 Tax=Stylophora pistillata TaxID=50429 RepID=UPI000C038E92|nr:uncharacterized protein LOC111321399 isoform X1 [Stylophora pistillata]